MAKQFVPWPAQAAWMAAWKAGAAAKVLDKVSKGKALNGFELSTLRAVAGPERYELKNPPQRVLLSENQIFEGYRKRVSKERHAAPPFPSDGDQLLPFVTVREQEAEAAMARGQDPVSWHGKYKMAFDTDDSVHA